MIMMAAPPGWASSGAPTNESVPSVSTSDGTNDTDGEDEEAGNDAEGVWSPDIEQSFQEALAIYPPCGRRKIILSDEGKMYGRNELIARYIKLRTGKTRTRKQVSSHIQVLARRKSKDIQSQLKSCPNSVAKEKALQSLSAMSSAQIVSASAMQRPSMQHPGLPPGGGLSSGGLPSGGSLGYQLGLGPQGGLWSSPPTTQALDLKPYPYSLPVDIKPPMPIPMPTANWDSHMIAGPKLRLCEFTSFLEHQHESDTQYSKHIFIQLGGTPGSFADPLESIDVRQIYDKFPEKKGGMQDLFEKGPQSAFYLVKFWADLNTNVQEDQRDFYGVTSQYESSEQMTISCSTKVCSFGKQVVEKVETEYSRFENGRFVYRIQRSPMCEYMVTFIHKLKQLPEKYMMNSVLENFTILQVVTNRDTQETLLCLAFVFEVSTSEHGAQHHIYKLLKESP